MKRNGTIVALASTAMLAVAALAAEPRIDKFVRYESGDIVIYTSRGEAQARRFVENLARFRATLERALGKRATQNSAPMSIVIAGNTDWRAWLQPRKDIAGYFQRARFSNYMAMDGNAPAEQTLQLIFHEYTHYYLATQFAGEYPPWFNEGLAELMGYARFQNNKVTLQVPVGHVYQAREGGWIPFAQLIRVDHSDPEYLSHKLMPSFYAQSWLAVHYGMVENRDFGRQIVQYINELNRLVPQEQAARNAFGDLNAVDKLLRDYSRRNMIPQGGMTLDNVPTAALSEGKPLEELDAMAIFADLMLETRLQPARIRPLVESLERRDTNKARAAILSARLAQADDDNASFDQAVERAEAALPPGDWELRRELASVLLTSGMESSPVSSRKSADTKRDLVRAHKWFAEAINHNNRDVEALWGYGTAGTLLDKDLDLAGQALVAAYKLAPSNSEISVSLANLKSNQQKPDEMIPYLEDTIRYATDLGTRRWAAETLVEVRAFIVQRDKELEENRKQREESEKMLAEYEKMYGKSKKK